MVANYGSFADTYTSLKHIDNVLVGVPQEYQPATFDPKYWRLSVHGKTIQLPSYITGLIGELPYRFEIKGSWDRKNATYPPHLLLHFFPKGKEWSYILLIDLDTCHIIEFSIQLQVSSKEIQQIPIEIPAAWKTRLGADE